MSASSVVVIGAGISGLSAAWWLHKASVDVTILEREETVGGTIGTSVENGWLVEAGPNSVLETTPLFRTLFTDIGIQDEVIYAHTSGNNRYILRNGYLHALPISVPAFFKSKLWTTSGKLRLLKEPFVGRADHEETVAEFVERRLGREFLDYAINPFVAGVYAGAPEQLSVRAAFPKLFALEEKYGGLIKGQIKGASERKKRAEKAKDRARMFSFRNGMQTLPRSIAAKLAGKVKTGVAVTGIIRNINDRGSRYSLSGRKGGSNLTFEADAILIATPSYTMAEIINPLDRSLADSLKHIYYPPVAEVSLGFQRSSIERDLNGFGYLIPAMEKRKILGTIWSSTLFPGRAPDGQVLLTTFVGGSWQPEFVSMDDGSLVEMVVSELSQIMNVRGQPVYRKVSRWEKAIPQYDIGHLSIMNDIAKFEERHQGIFLSGNYRGGISVGDCVMNSDKIANRIQAYLSKP